MKRQPFHELLDEEDIAVIAEDHGDDADEDEDVRSTLAWYVRHALPERWKEL